MRRGETRREEKRRHDNDNNNDNDNNTARHYTTRHEKKRNGNGKEKKRNRQDKTRQDKTRQDMRQEKTTRTDEYKMRRDGTVALLFFEIKQKRNSTDTKHGKKKGGGLWETGSRVPVKFL
jgi:hypothetical protein